MAGRWLGLAELWAVARGSFGGGQAVEGQRRWEAVGRRLGGGRVGWWSGGGRAVVGWWPDGRWWLGGLGILSL